MIVGAYGNIKQKSELTIKQIEEYVKSKTVLYNCRYTVMATCFGLSLDHLQANVFEYEVQSVRTVYCGIQYYLQGKVKVKVQVKVKFTL